MRVLVRVRVRVSPSPNPNPNQVHATVFGLLSEGLAPKRVAIVGFSQGAALAAEAALTLTLTLNPNP